MKRIIDAEWTFTIEQDSKYGMYWFCEDAIKSAEIDGFICSKRHFKTAKGCLNHLKRFTALNRIKNYKVKGMDIDVDDKF